MPMTLAAVRAMLARGSGRWLSWPWPHAEPEPDDDHLATGYAYPADDLERLEAWLAECVTVLELDPWRVHLDRAHFYDDDATGDHFPPAAETVGQPTTLQAIMTLGLRYARVSPELLRHTVAHEFGHVLTSGMLAMLYNAGADDEVASSIVLEAETERLGHILAPLLPLPPTDLAGPIEQ